MPLLVQPTRIMMNELGPKTLPFMRAALDRKDAVSPAVLHFDGAADPVSRVVPEKSLVK